MCWGINQTTWTSYSWEFNDWTISPNYACVLAAQRSAVRVCGFKCVEDIQGSCCVVMCGHGQSTLLFARFKWSQIAWHRQLHRTQPVQHVRIPTSEHSWSVEQVEPSLVDRSISGMADKFFYATTSVLLCSKCSFVANFSEDQPGAILSSSASLLNPTTFMPSFPSCLVYSLPSFGASLSSPAFWAFDSRLRFCLHFGILRFFAHTVYHNEFVLLHFCWSMVLERGPQRQGWTQ